MPQKDMSKQEIEEGIVLAPKYGPDGFLPVVATDADSGEVMMMAYMNEEALLKTIETGEAHYYSRSRQGLWHKGATSGQVQKIVDIRTDCDQDAIWLKISPQGNGGCCHVGYRSCFYRAVPVGSDGEMEFRETEKLE